MLTHHTQNKTQNTYCIRVLSDSKHVRLRDCSVTLKYKAWLLCTAMRNWWKISPEHNRELSDHSHCPSANQCGLQVNLICILIRPLIYLYHLPMLPKGLRQLIITFSQKDECSYGVNIYDKAATSVLPWTSSINTIWLKWKKVSEFTANLYRTKSCFLLWKSIPVHYKE